MTPQTFTTTHGPQTLEGLFIHQNQVETIKSMMERGPVLLVGGRGIGKSEIAQRIATDLGTTLLRGERMESPSELCSGATSNPGHMVLDDLDALVESARISVIEGKPGAREDLKTIARELRPRILRWNENAQLLLTSAVNLQGPRIYNFWDDLQLDPALRAELKEFSDASQQPAVVVVNPWQSRWETDFTQSLQRMFPNHQDQAAHWAQKLAHFTGGYPALFRPVLRELRLDPSL